MSRELTAAALRYYAALCERPSERTNLVVARREDVALMGAGGPDWMGFGQHPGTLDALPRLTQDPGPPEFDLRSNDRDAVDRLARLSVLHADEDLIRLGWVAICGTIERDGTAVRVLQPLVERPMTVRTRSVAERALAVLDESRPSTAKVMTPRGEAEMSALIEDQTQRAELLEDTQFGGGALTMRGVSEELLKRTPRLSGWIRTSCVAAGLPVARILPPTEDPFEWIARPGLVAIATHFLYLTRQVHAPSLQNSLLNWSARPGIEHSALTAMLVGEHGDQDEDVTAGDIDSPMQLTASQREVLHAARTRPITVVSGAPGSGKTHALCAVALDAVGRGQSVLIATQSRHAAEVVTEMLQRTPGPEPVRFGDGASMAELVDELGDRQAHPVDAAELRRLDADLDLTTLELERLSGEISGALRTERLAADAARFSATLPTLVRLAPGAFRLDSDVEQLGELLERVRAAETSGSPVGLLSRWRSRRARRTLYARCGADPDEVQLPRLALAIEAARTGRAAATLASTGGTTFEDRWQLLWDATGRHRIALGARLRARPFESSALDSAGRAAIGQLVTALRAGRGRRRELLGTLRPGVLTTATPLWVGTLAEIEDVLPASAALFDLVVLDEASQIEQSRAAPALLRAGRAVVVGDPRQLRHVSFRADADIDRALADAGLGEWRGVLDTRRVSTFDLAAARAPAHQLRDHFRSIPHLIEFSVRRFYRDRIDVMTRHPRNESVDAIDVVQVPAPLDATSNVHAGEIDAVIDLVRALHLRGERSVGVVSPFRDQADAIEAALLEAFDAEALAELALRVGTVHAFQGGERDVVIASLGLGPKDPAGRFRFAQDPNLFNVMVTRARRAVIAVTSLPVTVDGLIGDYLRYADAALPPVEDAGALDDWQRELADELRRNGASVRTGYPVGPWRLGLVAGDGERSQFLETRVVDDGVAAHIERRLMLMDLGWHVVDAYPSRWDGDAVRAALALRPTDS